MATLTSASTSEGLSSRSTSGRIKCTSAPISTSPANPNIRAAQSQAQIPSTTPVRHPLIAQATRIPPAQALPQNPWTQFNRFCSSSRIAGAVAIVTLGVGAYYYYGQYRISFETWQLGIWKDCRDRQDISNTSACHYYDNISYDKIISRSLDYPTRTSHVYQMADNTSNLPLLTIVLLLIPLLISIFVVGQIAITYTTAYLAAPNEFTTFIDAVYFSIQENESYGCYIAKFQRLEDKLRLGKLLREIQMCGDGLREDLNGLLIEECGVRLRSSTRLLWAAKRGRLEERLRRLDLLRMRFLIVYMGIVASKTTSEHFTSKDPKKHHGIQPNVPHALIKGIKRNPRQSTQTTGHNDYAGISQRQGWAGVVAELQNSPLIRHASTQSSMASPK